MSGHRSGPKPVSLPSSNALHASASAATPQHQHQQQQRPPHTRTVSLGPGLGINTSAVTNGPLQLTPAHAHSNSVTPSSGRSFYKATPPNAMPGVNQPRARPSNSQPAPMSRPPSHPATPSHAQSQAQSFGSAPPPVRLASRASNATNDYTPHTHANQYNDHSHDDTVRRRASVHHKSHSASGLGAPANNDPLGVPVSPNALSYHVDLNGARSLDGSINATIISPALRPSSPNHSVLNDKERLASEGFAARRKKAAGDKSLEDGFALTGHGANNSARHAPVKQSFGFRVRDRLRRLLLGWRARDAKKDDDYSSRKRGESASKQILAAKNNRKRIVTILAAVLVMAALGWALKQQRTGTLHDMFWPVPSTSPVLATSAPYTIISMLHDMNDEYRSSHRAAFLFQLNAVRSWLRLVPAAQIILYMDTPQACDYFRAMRAEFAPIRCQPVPCSNEKYQRPRLDCLFNHANEHASTEIIAFVNGDIVLSPYLNTILESVRAQYGQHFAMVSRRTDTFIEAPTIDSLYSRLDEDHTNEVLSISNNTGTMHSEFGIDLFVYTRTVFATLQFPPFLAGVYRWDNWLLSTLILKDEMQVVDATTKLLVVHQQNETHGPPHPGRKGNDYADQLVKSLIGDKYKIGHIGNANMLVRGMCPQCTFEENPNVSLHVSLAKHAHPSMWITIVPVIDGDEFDAFSAHCYYTKINVKHYLFLAKDAAIYNKLRTAHLPVVFTHGVPDSGVNYASDSHAVLMAEHEFLMDVMKLNYHFLYLDVHSLMLADPLDSIAAAPYAEVMLKKQTSGRDLVKNEFSSAIYAVRSSKMGQYYWNQVKECRTTNGADCVALKYQKIGGALVKGVLDHFQYTDMWLALVDKWPQLNGYYPLVLVTNKTVSADPAWRRELLKQWKLSVLFDPQSKECAIVRPPLLSPPTSAKQADFQLKIRVLTFDRYESLSRLLSSLNEANYDGDANIQLEIAIDKPVNMSDTVVVEKNSKTIETAKQFNWRHGPSVVQSQETHKGLVGQWTTGWFPASDTEILLVLEDDTAVSPHFYRWTKQMIQTYYLDPQQYDPRMYGFALQLQHTILGETLKERYGSRKVHNLVGNSTHLFRYQLVGTWGGVFFPQHWKVFLTWLREKQFVPALGVSNIQPEPFKPCVPAVLSNDWWANKTHKVWSQWFIRFAYENGWYNVYTNFGEDPALSSAQYESNATSLVGNYREAGDNFNRTKGMMNPMVATLTDAMMEMPPLNTLPLFDFHFHRVYDPALLALRNSIYDEAQIDKCWTMKEFIARKKAKEAADRVADDKKKLKEENKKRLALGLKPVGSLRELQASPKTTMPPPTTSAAAKKPATAPAVKKPAAPAKPATPAPLPPAAPVQIAAADEVPAAEAPVADPVAEGTEDAAAAPTEAAPSAE